MFKGKFSEVLFGLFYIILFPLQILPSLAIIMFDLNSIVFWVMCVVGMVAMITQAIKFPCVPVRFWNIGMFAFFIGSIFAGGLI